MFKDGRLLATSLADNVALMEHPDVAEVERCLAKAALADMPARLSRGLDTPIQKRLDSNGVELSGGEDVYKRQKCSLFSRLNGCSRRDLFGRFGGCSRRNLFSMFGGCSRRDLFGRFGGCSRRDLFSGFSGCSRRNLIGRIDGCGVRSLFGGFDGCQWLRGNAGHGCALCGYGLFCAGYYCNAGWVFSN